MQGENQVQLLMLAKSLLLRTCISHSASSMQLEKGKSTGSLSELAATLSSIQPCIQKVLQKPHYPKQIVCALFCIY